ncbi:YjbH domain-containing protein [Paracoccus benzoatiresistens]|uniref:YjbH domain-containing protein n=1 Tax=Paracoccus benzoatiresistens TaxID=2997341 RepID=A0ABT4JB57_9RHOB|nr:YjbH domain-containing protein [Paracoccus sp. EF6]MCZ0964365.1 YjbH domain-containing protein [Paracoccus sp. EF6]
MNLQGGLFVTRKALLIGGVWVISTSAGHSQDGTPVGLSVYGVPGHIEMPSAEVLPDGNLALSANIQAGGVVRGNMAFQISPRLTGVFRYSYLEDYSSDNLSLYDRSFDLRYQVMRENRLGWQPSVSIGLQDFGGTGVYGAEYVVTSKHFGEDFFVTAGIGWGRFGTYNSFNNPLGVIDDRFDTRPGSGGISETGKVDFDRFFRGPAAAFFGVNWQATDKLKASLEYSSDAMVNEVDRMGFDYRTPINLGLQYSFNSGSTLGLALIHGSAATLSYSVLIDPAKPKFPSGREAAPPAVLAGTNEAVMSWGEPAKPDRDRLRSALRDQGIGLEGISIEGPSATVAISNLRWSSSAQSWGRTARVLSQQLPAEVTEFRIQDKIQGMTSYQVSVTREDLEELEYAPDGAWQAFVRAKITDGAGLPDPRWDPEKTWSVALGPYLQPALFDPDNPARADLGAELFGEWSPVQGVYISGAARQKIIGNLDEITRRSDSELPHVRSDTALYFQSNDPYIPFLTAEHFARPAPNIYTRATVGLFERMYGGVSGEVLWTPVDQRYAFGAELNYAVQRDFEGLGFQDYDVVTGHVSGYYNLGGGYQTQVDLGRYLAGDWGGTLSLTRRFENGFSVGAFFTLTDVSSDEFGEGAFDKGISFSVPVSWLTGLPSRGAPGTVIRPIQRDGGARLYVRNRLYDLTRNEREAAQGQRWGRFWR